MRHIVFEEKEYYSVAILIKDSSLNKEAINRNYIKPLKELGISPSEVVVFGLDYQPNGKAPVKFIKEYMEKLQKPMQHLGVKILYVADGNYFKPMTKAKKVEPYYGFKMPCVLLGYEDISVTAGIAYPALYHNPALKSKMGITLGTLADMHFGRYKEPGKGIIDRADYPQNPGEIVDFLDSLHQYDEISCDIETFSLKPETSGIGTIAFAWAENQGGAFPVDLVLEEHGDAIQLYSSWNINSPIRALLKDFFMKYEGTIIYHGITFDAKILVRHLFMQDAEDYENQLAGTEIMTKNVLCTKILTYLATNNAIQNKLDLKSNAQEFAGNWAQADIKDIRKIPLPTLLQYNLIDALSTIYLKNKYMPTVYADNQKEIHDTLFLPCIPMIINAELNGMPMTPVNIKEAERHLVGIMVKYMRIIEECPLIIEFTEKMRTEEWIKENLLLKTKVKDVTEFTHIKFKAGSRPQLQRLLFEEWGFPILEKTKTGAPATGGEILLGLLARLRREHKIKDEYLTATVGNFPPTEIIHQARVLNALVEWGSSSKIQSTFIKAFKEGRRGKDGKQYLQGNFNLTGTKSGRLSSSDPNLQNLPSTGSVYAKMVKRCFEAPSGWLLCGADFDSLEDKISALTTKDPNKLKVYTDGYDGHCLRAHSYFKSRMPDITDTVESINSIKKLYPDERQDSKGPTFLLTYDGTYHGMVKQFGFTKKEAQAIEENYHELYKVSDEWKFEKIAEASKKGYVEVAFGLRLRTPLLARTDLNKSYTPYEAQAESRTAGNALGQSYCMLNNRAALEFMKRVDKSPHRLNIKLSCLIHDAIYLLVKDDINVVKWVNDNLPDCMAWNDLPEIQHPVVKLSGALDIFYPSWADEIHIPNGSTEADIYTICEKAMA